MDIIPSMSGLNNLFNPTGSVIPSMSSLSSASPATPSSITDTARAATVAAATPATPVASGATNITISTSPTATKTSSTTGSTITNTAYSFLTTVPLLPTITGLPSFPSITGLPSAPTALTMPTLSFTPIIPTANVAEIQTANPIRIQSMNNVIEKQTAYNAQMPILQNAKIPAEVLSPMKKYLDDEVSWWKTNILLNLKQVQDRTALYTQAIKALTADLEKNIINTLGAMSPEDYTVAINKLSSAQPSQSLLPSLPSLFSFFSSPAADTTPKTTTTGFADMSPSVAITVVDMSKVKEESKKLNDNTAAENKLYNSENLNFWDYTKAAFSSVFRFNIILSIIFFTFTIVIASYVANDNLHKEPAFRVLKFLGTILFTVFSPFGYLFMWGLIIYYIYRGISYNFFDNINNRIIALAILPLLEMDAEDYNNANILTKYLYVYTLEGQQNEQINSVVIDRKNLYIANRLECTKYTHELQKQLKDLR